MAIPASPESVTSPVPLAPPALTRSSSPQIDHLFSTLVEATFDLIEELGSGISLLLYLHVPHDDQPLLFVRYPDMANQSPTETFRLMHTVIMLSNGRKPTAAFRHGDLSGHYNRSTGEESDGLFVFGGIQTAEMAARITSVSRAFARVLHQFHLEDIDAQGRPSIHIDAVNELMQASVSIPAGERALHGTATAVDAEQAVARAVIDACAQGYGFDEVRRIDVGTRSAVLVVARDATQMLRLGLAISDGDILQTVALAARRATGHED